MDVVGGPILRLSVADCLLGGLEGVPRSNDGGWQPCLEEVKGEESDEMKEKMGRKQRKHCCMSLQSEESSK